MTTPCGSVVLSALLYLLSINPAQNDHIQVPMSSPVYAGEKPMPRWRAAFSRQLFSFIALLCLGSLVLEVDASPGRLSYIDGSMRLTRLNDAVDGHPRLVARADKNPKPKNAGFNDNVSGVPVFGWLM